MNLRANMSLQGWKCQVQATTDSPSFGTPDAGGQGRIASWNNGIKVICVSVALLS